MNKAELVVAVSEKVAGSKKDVENVINAALEEIEKALLAGDEVKISGFGIFEKKGRAARVGTNPSSGAKIEIPASNTVGFKPSKGLREKLN